MKKEEQIGVALTAKPSQMEAMGKDYRGEVDKPTPSDKDRRLLKFGEVAWIINVSRATVWRMVRDGRLPTVEIRTGTYRVPSQALTDLLSQAKRKGGHQ